MSNNTNLKVEVKSFYVRVGTLDVVIHSDGEIEFSGGCGAATVEELREIVLTYDQKFSKP